MSIESDENHTIKAYINLEDFLYFICYKCAMFLYCFSVFCQLGFGWEPR